MASSLATRCTACATVFRVVPDQLRVSDGWVRCGRCSEVFNAAEHLVDAHSGAPRRLGDAAPPAPGHQAPAQAAERLYDPGVDGAYDDGSPPAHGSDAAGHPAPALAAVSAPAATRSPPPPPPPPPDDITIEDWHADDAGFGHTQQQAAPEPIPAAPAPDIRFEPHIGDSLVSISPASSALRDLDDLRATPRDGSAPPAESAAATPSFLRQAERAQRWKQPRVRIALWALTVLAGLGLAGQVLFVYRDLAAARFTLLRPPLEQACNWLGCSVGEAHAIDSLVVESSGLVRVEKSSVYKLSMALRNRAAIALAVPAVEIALTDAQGKLLARRVLRATELGSTQPAVAAGRDLALQATLQAATEPVAGYTIELFYP